MPEAFDPSRKWLGIPAAEQPPHHYRLLAIAPFEQDADVIETAADLRMSHLRTYQTGPHSALSQKLLNEVTAAKLCLLDTQKKTEYDATLRRRLEAAQRPTPAVAITTSTPMPVRAVAPTPAAPAEPQIAYDFSLRRAVTPGDGDELVSRPVHARSQRRLKPEHSALALAAGLDLRRASCSLGCSWQAGMGERPQAWLRTKAAATPQEAWKRPRARAPQVPRFHLSWPRCSSRSSGPAPWA
jgi:hypothetical protein